MAADQPGCAAAVTAETPQPTALFPVQLLLHFHRAFREELTELCRIAAEGGRDAVAELRRRFEFFKLAYKYHSASEDQVIFRALDVHVKNVVFSYALEHKSNDELLDSISHYLDILVKDEQDMPETFQKLVHFISTLQSSIFLHMAKEEEQVFPLLMQQFSFKEQATLIWRFMCSIPTTLLKDILLWMTCYLSTDERVDVLCCLKKVVPEEILLQEVLLSCLYAEKQTSLKDDDTYGKGGLFLNECSGLEKILKLRIYDRRSVEETNATGGQSPINGLHLWHGALRKDLNEILKELYLIQNSNEFPSLGPVVSHLKFFSDVLLFYSYALDKIFYNMFSELVKDCPLPTFQRFLEDSKIESLQQLLYSDSENVTPTRSFVEMLCTKLEICLRGIDKHFSFLEKEFFPFVGMTFTNEIQQFLLYSSLEMMPLGMIKCTACWFSYHLTEDEIKLILVVIRQGCPLVSNSLSSLLYDWVRISYLGKASVEKFRIDLQEIFNNRFSFMPQQGNEDSGFSRLQSLVITAKDHVSSSSFVSGRTDKDKTSYSSDINYQVFFPQTLKLSSPYSTKNSISSSKLSVTSTPMDHIFFFHKALKKDLQNLVSSSGKLAEYSALQNLISASGKLAENNALLMEFKERFHLVNFLYQIHSDSEDGIAFPALEAKIKFQNSSLSYTIDHKLEIEHFNKISFIIDQIYKLQLSISSGDMDTQDKKQLMYHQLCLKLHGMCESLNRVLSDHVNHEEIELWPLFTEHFSLEEQEKIIGSMLGRTRAETLKQMIPWLMAYLTTVEHHSMLSLWRKVTKNTKFDQWLEECWDGVTWHHIVKAEKESSVPPPWAADALGTVSVRLPKKDFDDQGHLSNKSNEHTSDKVVPSETLNACDKLEGSGKNQLKCQSSKSSNFSSGLNKERSCKEADIGQMDKNGKLVDATPEFRHQEDIPKCSQEELEGSIRSITCESMLDPGKKSIMIQNLLKSPDTEMKSHSESMVSHKQEVPGLCPSYRDPRKLDFGCQHYKRNCKLVAACCNRLYTCRHCHDAVVVDHSMDRKATVKMMCMKCLIIQPIGPACSTISCNKLSMGRYYCSICKLFDDERQIYHCPFCNLCRVGKGLGIDYFHCMNCNACMSRSLSIHSCREKCFEDFCPICQEYIFTSISPVKALPCGHLMHSSCFQDYTCSSYTCPICSKSLGDMQVYFGMLDALLAEEKIPDEYSGKIQAILCNDCEKRGTARFHWLYHKCSHCGSYNTRLL